MHHLMWNRVVLEVSGKNSELKVYSLGNEKAIVFVIPLGHEERSVVEFLTRELDQFEEQVMTND